MPTALHKTYQIKIALRHVRPPVWRRLLVPSTIKLPALHETLQIAMGWSDTHLHQFVKGNRCFGIPEPGFPADVQDERKVRLDALLSVEGDVIDYEYDLGDGWRHAITLEKILPFDPRQRLPLCLKGARACPPEDCGGPWGYRALLRLGDDALDEVDAEVFDWLPPDFDPEYFDASAVNMALRGRPDR